MDKMSGFVLRSAKKANIPVRIAHSHNTESEGGLLAKMYKWYAGSRVRSSATHSYACSLAAAKWLFGGRSDQAFILKNGIEIDRFQFCMNSRVQIRKEWRVMEDTLVLGHVGRFSHQKNHFFLLDIFAGIHKKVPNAMLILVGDGPLKSEIAGKIKKLKLEGKVKLLGVREDINRLLQAFDLFVFPSLHEGLPVTLIEVQGAGLPCLISNNITKEVDMEMGLVQHLPITDKNVWINQIINHAKDSHIRTISADTLSRKGYDIRKTAVFTQTSYLSLGEAAT